VPAAGRHHFHGLSPHTVTISALCPPARSVRSRLRTAIEDCPANHHTSVPILLSAARTCRALSRTTFCGNTPWR